jgi:hypothetical protein
MERTHMPIKANPIIAMSAPATVTAAEDAKGPARFTSTFYTGGAMNIAGYDLPVVIDLAGLEEGKVLVANLDHDQTKRVGNFAVANDGKTLVANGTASAATSARDEVVQSAAGGYQWQSSLEVNPKKIETVKAGKKVTVNGQELEGPLYVTRKGVLKGFAFVSHGADDNTTATIAASAAHTKEKSKMKAEIKAWAENMGIDVDNATPEQIATIESNYIGKATKPAKINAADPFAERKQEAQRREDIRNIADKLIDARNSDPDEIVAIEKMHDHAIAAKMSSQEFRIELYESTIPQGRTVSAPRHGSVYGSDKEFEEVITAAICAAGRLENYEKQFNDRVLQTAHDQFKGRISLGEVFYECAQRQGYKGRVSAKVTNEVQNAAFGFRQQNAGGFSTVSIPNVISNTANKFLMVGWNSVDMTPMRIALVRPVNDFKEITTVSLTGDLQFEKVGAAGEIKHGSLGDLAYGNKVDTYAKMLAITRQDIINDDLGALTSAPRRLGRGSALKLNDIFWTAFLDNSSFFTSGNSNVNTGVADMTLGGLAATESIFMLQTDPDGKPLGTMPAILVVPQALKALAIALMDPQSKVVSGNTAGQSDVNVFAGRFRVESSPYISNSSYTGYSASAWYMIADPQDLPVIEIAALNGRVEPVVETADAAFNVLGVEIRGYSDVGVRKQEYRAGVRADGGSS